MARGTRRKAPANPEGRMPLREHIAELRRRLIKSALGIAVGSVAGWYLFGPLFRILQQPLKTIAEQNGIISGINYANIMQAFNLHLQMAVYLGIVLASPIWLYQLWAFVMPGLTRKEKLYSFGFAAAGTPLLVGGIWIGWLVVPNAVKFFAGFAEPGAAFLPDAGTYFSFVTRLLLVFGLAFLLPLFLVALNMAGLMSARTMAKGWRIAVFAIFVFAAVASPTPDAGSMLALALPMCLLYAAAVGFSALMDRRRAKRGGAFGKLDDDEASVIDAPTPVDEPAPLDGTAPAESTHAANGRRFDDVT